MFTKWIFPDYWQVTVVALSYVLHQRSAWRLNIIFTAMLFAKGRKTITSWLRAAGINRCYKAYYYFIGSLGNKTENIATELLKIMIQTIYKQINTVLMAIDDSPTPRYGPNVAGAGIHINRGDTGLDRSTRGSGVQVIGDPDVLRRACCHLAIDRGNRGQVDGLRSAVKSVIEDLVRIACIERGIGVDIDVQEIDCGVVCVT